jgi:hypothetical protein
MSLSSGYASHEIDELTYKLGLDVKFPWSITVKEDLNCVRLGPNQCRVNYRCAFGFPKGWRGAVTRIILRRGLDSGPLNSLNR